jgi:hypothetical protein
MDSHFEGLFAAAGAVADAALEDLREVWKLYQSLPSDTGAVGMELVKEICNPRGDSPAACYRIMMLQMLNRVTGSLTRWLREGKFDDAVYRVAAIFPVKWMEPGHIYNEFPFDAEEFRKQVDDVSGR